MDKDAKVFDDITFEYTSCSYDITPEYNDSYSAITAMTKAGENVKFTIVGNRVISYTQNDKDYNFKYSTSINEIGTTLTGTVKDINIAFRINIPSESEHDIYVHIPAIVNVNKLPIADLKAKPIGDFENFDIEGTIYQNLFMSNAPGPFKGSTYGDKKAKLYMATCSAIGGDFDFDGVRLLFKDSNGAYLKADSSLFTNMVFTGNVKMKDGQKKFSIMLIREYVNNQENFMNRHIRVFSITDPIDAEETLTLTLVSNDEKRIGFSINCKSFNFDNAEYYMECSASTKTDTSVTTSNEEVNSVNINGYKEINEDGTPKDTIYFNWDSITNLASPDATFFAKLENGLMLKIPMKFNSTVIKYIKIFVS